ncbi:MFS transporter [Aequorivita viscosa]|uniref:MFS transporter, FSR family, fosmidomycin resistance protein n=1 Tax=Aequorivita viscosa TaxID=797419 RepID=A0A1M6LJQ8_9FLAO|nr:MFS transporter [Aequorivita viscosa]SDV99465.1 MFS transporter, FSR family, fosmidomycin resistance protein [Aequorivita viscosa]SHJ71457.1 MFS transporter, FSR family, fosmidomycin resistance protein [Aequorivita viscosa]
MSDKALNTIDSKLVQKTVYPILFAIAFSHFLNDLLQIVIPSIYPLLKENFSLSFTQIGFITFVYQLTASLLQPVVGFHTDKKPMPYSLAFGMGFTMLGLTLLAFASNYFLILVSVALVGVGSSIFHPEASRVAYLASGGKRGLAQSIFQVGGNSGTAIGPLLVILLVIPYGQTHILWFLLFALLGIFVLSQIARWYKKHLIFRKANKIKVLEYPPRLRKKQVKGAIGILLVLIFSKYIYMTSISSYFTFYLIDKFGVSIPESQFYLFLFFGSVALGTFLGGPLGDRFGRKYVIWFSILGSAPFALLLPYVDLFWTGTLVIMVGLVLSSAFSAILVFAQELLPGKVGMISGLFFGFAFGIAGLGSAALGYLADHTSITFVYKLCSFLPLIGGVAYFLPNLRSKPAKLK